MIKWAAMCAVPAAVAGGAYLHGPIVWGTVYEKSPAEVAATLESMQLPRYFGTALEMVDGGSTRMTIPGQSVVYLFQARGGQAAKFIADITPVDATHTRVSTRMELSPDAERLLKTEVMPGAAEFEEVGTAAMNEHIDAKLTGRPVNEMIERQAMARFAMSHMGEIQKGVADTLNESMEQADADEAERVASHAPVIVPGRPMSDPANP
jgi:hypothetical protein